MNLVSANGDYNTAGGVLTYTRDALSRYDVTAATTSSIPDAGTFVTGSKTFTIEFNNSDPALVGKQILTQLENSSVAAPSNFPAVGTASMQLILNMTTV